MALQDKLDDAAECFAQTLRLNPEHAGAHYSLGIVQSAQGRYVDASTSYRQALRLRGIISFDHEEPFAAVIRCTADRGKVDKRTRSKWSRALRYALEYKSDSEPLDRHHVAGRLSSQQAEIESGLQLSRLSGECLLDVVL